MCGGSIGTPEPGWGLCSGARGARCSRWVPQLSAHPEQLLLVRSRILSLRKERWEPALGLWTPGFGLFCPERAGPPVAQPCSSTWKSTPIVPCLVGSGGAVEGPLLPGRDVG